MATIADLNSLISVLTNADTTSFPNADRLLLINKHYNDVHNLILESQDEWDYDDSNKTDFPILTGDFTASQQPYTLPSGTIDVKRLEVTYDGTNWVKAEPFDVNERGISVASNNLGDFSQAEPKYDLMSNAFFIYPIPESTVNEGMKLWIGRGPALYTSAELTTGTKEPGFDSLFHDLLSFGVAADYALIKNLPQANGLRREYEEKKMRLKKHYSDKQEDRVYRLNMSYNSFK